MLKSTENQQNENLLQETPMLKSTKNQQILSNAEFLARKCFIKDELNDMKILKRYPKNFIKYFKGNTLRIYGIKLNQRIVLLVYLQKI